MYHIYVSYLCIIAIVILFRCNSNIISFGILFSKSGVNFDRENDFMILLRFETHRGGGDPPLLWGISNVVRLIGAYKLFCYQARTAGRGRKAPHFRA